MFKDIPINKLLWIVPGVVAFFIALIPTLTYQWPLTLDIFYHVHIAQVYSQYGLTLIDPLTDPPNGTLITYPPLFSMIIMVLGTILKVDYFQIARFLQPILALAVVLSVSYVAKKFYGDIAGISAGFLVMSSYLFSRIVSPLPETLALVFVPLTVYLFYKSVTTKKYNYALLSSLLFLVVIATHQATTLLLFLIITSIAIVVGIIRREKSFLISYAYFLSLPVIIGIILSVAAIIFAPNFVSKIFTYGLTAVTGYTTSVPTNQPISYDKYLAYLGIMMIFVISGAVVAIKRIETKDIFVLVWIVVIFLISNSYLFGVNVYTIRVLVHLLLPLSILGGMGLSYLYLDYKKREFSSKSIRSFFLISIFIISTLFAFTTVTAQNFNVLPKYNSQPYQFGELKIPQIAPPTTSDVELAEWFNAHGDKKLAIVSNDYETNQFLVATTNQPIAGVATSEHVIEWGFGAEELSQKDIGYYVFDKRLTYSSYPNKIISEGGFIYYNENNLTSLLPPRIQLLYENKYYMVFKV